MKGTTVLTVFLALLPGAVRAERAASPGDATVFVRLVGNIHAEIEDTTGVKRTADLDHVEIGTGSGFVISPLGYVLTNEHVIGDHEFLVTSNGRQARVAVKVLRIQVCFPQAATGAQGVSSQCSEASVSASDPALDLAVLFINGTNLPYVALGDSDAVAAGLPVDALGYPFGRDVEVGKIATAPDLVPEISTTPGAISALRAGDAGERRYIQITNTLNPGNSGGPLVNRDGFAVGVIRMNLRRATGIGFAIPINEAKNFLESHGLDHLMPAHRMRIGSFETLESKGLGLKLVEGMADVSPFRSRVESDPRSGSVMLRIDRVLSPMSAQQIERTLVTTETFERVAAAASESHNTQRPGTVPLLLGHASDNEHDIRMDYAILNLGPEKIVARFLGRAEQMAYNESVLRESLVSLEARALRVADPGPVDRIDWSSTEANTGQAGVPIPLGWIVEPSGPAACPGLGQPAAMTAAFPAGDFTISLRAAVWSAGTVVPSAGASACSTRRGSVGNASYTSRADWLGVSYFLEGAFVQAGPKVIQLEVVTPDQKSGFASALLAAWIKRVAE
jgi:hypothetical protein